jgi:glycosyltransferase involved in cell wall biosynthesis
MRTREAKSINVLFVSPSYKPYLGGTERIVEQLSKEYLQFDKVNKVGVLTTRMDFNYMPPKENFSLPAEEVIDGLKVYRLNFSPKKLKFFYCLPAGLFSWEAKRVIQDFQPHIVHFLLTEWYFANTWIYFLTRKKSRHVFTIAFHEPPGRLRYLLMKYFNAFLGRLVDKVQVYSLHLKKRIMEYYYIPSKKIKIIPLGFTPSPQKQIVEKGVSKNCLSLLAVGRLSEDKGQLELVRIFHRVITKLDKDVKLRLVGGDGGQRREIEQYIQQNHLSNHVELMGFIPEDRLHLLYQQADLFILLTRVESFGLVFAEAQSNGLPLIGYRISALEALFRKGAVLVEPFDQDKVAEAIQDLVNDDHLRRELGVEALEYARHNFAWKKTAQDLMNLYNQITKDLN